MMDNATWVGEMCGILGVMYVPIFNSQFQTFRGVSTTMVVAKSEGIVSAFFSLIVNSCRCITNLFMLTLKK